MKLTRLLIPICCLAWLASCSSDDDGLTSDPGEQPGGQIKFEIAFAGQSNTGLKVATASDFKSTWETGDEIGLFAVKHGQPLAASGNYLHNVKLTRQSNGSWSGDAYWPNTGETYDFYAYYPYVAGIDPTDYTFSVQTDQSGETNSKSNYNLSDLLLAQNDNGGSGFSKGATSVSLIFSHALSLVQVEVKREVNVPHFDADDFTVTLTNALPAASLSWTSDLTGTGTPTDIVMHKVADATGYIYRALVPAQTLAADSKVTFVQNTTGKVIDMEYQGIKSAALTAKNAHKYSVTLGWGIDPNHAYAVGDVYPHTGPAIGIVYWIDPASSGKHGKVVGLKEFIGQWADNNFDTKQTDATDMDNGLKNMQTIAGYIGTTANNASWANFPAFNWVHSMNDTNEDYNIANVKGVWYLPARNELGNYNSNSLYDAYASDKAGFNQKLTSAGGTPLSDVIYWGSSESIQGFAVVVSFGVGSTGANPKLLSSRARCVLAF